MEFTKEDLEIQKQHIRLDDLNKKLRKEFYLMKFYNYLEKLDKKGYSFSLKVSRNFDYSPKDALQKPYYYNKRKSDIVKNNNGFFESVASEDYETYHEYLEDIFDKVFCYELNEQEIINYFINNSIINSQNFANFVNHLKENTELDKSFNHILPEVSNNKNMDICGFELPNMISSKKDYNLYDSISFSIENKIKENLADCVYILFKNIIQNVNNDKIFYFIKEDNNKHSKIENIIFEENGIKKNVEFKEMPLEDYYPFAFLIHNIYTIDKNNISEIISSLPEKGTHHIATICMGEKSSQKIFINLNRFLLEEEFKDGVANNNLNKRNRL